jgi:hypothetical protein
LKHWFEWEFVPLSIQIPTKRSGTPEVKFSELTEEENNAIDAFINEYYSDGDFYEDI